MSFRQNGNRRYGAVPPAQYGAAAQDVHPPLRGQSSFDNGDDAQFSDNSTTFGRGVSAGRPAQPELGFDSVQNDYQPSRGPYGSDLPSASSSYQFQPSSSSPPSHTLQSPSSYNPQQFARTLSQSQSQSAAYQSNAQVYSGTGGHGSIQPYNPALYQDQASLQQMPSQSSQIPYNYNQSYASPTVPQSSHYWPPQASYESTYSQYQPGPSAPPTSLPPKPAAYIPPPQAAPYNSLPYPSDRPSSQHGRNSIRTSTSSDFSHRAMPTPLSPQREAAFSSSGLQRHPTSRPLPSAPVEEEPAGDWNDAETLLDQERLFDDISSNLQQQSNRSSAAQHRNGDLWRYDSQASTLHSVNDVRRTTYGEESDDPEAAAGLEAMRLADQEDIHNRSSLFESYNDPTPSIAEPTYPDTSSDSDYAHATMDMGLYSGGYDAHLSYGASNFDVGGRTNMGDEMGVRSRPLPMPTPQAFQRPEEHSPPLGLGGMVSYQDNPASILEQSNRHRAYSYENGDEGSSIPSAGVDSRLSGKSGNSSPSKDGYDDFYYGPGPNASGDRPLPALPTDVQQSYNNNVHDGRSGESYGNNRDSQYAWLTEATQPYFAPNGYEQPQSSTDQMLAIPRSVSHTSSSNHPKAMAPIRAKTDAEERQAAKHRVSRQLLSRGNGSLDGYDSGPSIAPDLPILPAGGRRKKFSPEKLSSGDFDRCSEPWAMSKVADWLQEMCRGETDLVDSDLKENMLSQGLVNLFTHKVPTMNTTDAEILSQHVIQNMFEVGLLIRDEEWVKLGAGEISGVLWQMTGSGCYSPRIHIQEIPGRCYSRHCSRTLKKATLQPSESHKLLKPELEYWDFFYKITDEQKKGKSKDEISLQFALHEPIAKEDQFMGDLYILESLYRDGLLASQPPVIAPNRLERLVEEIFGNVAAVKKVNEEHLLPQLKYKQQTEGPWLSTYDYGDIFREWIRKARPHYIKYASGMPYAIYQYKKEKGRNVMFAQFLDSVSRNELCRRLEFDNFLKAPIARLQRYPLLLGVALEKMQDKSDEERTTMAKAIEEIKAVAAECDSKVDEMTKICDLRDLSSKLVMRPGISPSDLLLKDPERRILFKGELQRMGNNRVVWLDSFAILYDHYFILAKVVHPSKENVDGKRVERYDVSKPPIPMQLLILEGANDDPVMKRDVKGIGAVTTTARSTTPLVTDARSRNANGDRPHPLNHTNTTTSMDSGSTLTPKMNFNTTLEPDEKLRFPFRIKHLGRTDVYTLYAATAQQRESWCEHIMAAKTEHAASLHKQNAEPFKLRVIADSAFVYDDATAATKRDSGVIVRETPLYRAIREVEKVHGPMRPSPVCRAQVNCAASFIAYNKPMIAIGTEIGVFISEKSNNRGWTKVITRPNVTQIAVLEEFQILVVLGSKSLIAYHLDEVVHFPSDFPPPVRNSASKEPQRLTGTNTGFFTTCRYQDRTLLIYKKRESTTSVFKALEPVFRKSTEKKAKLFGRKSLSGASTEFFREHDDFFIPTESYGLNVFNKTIAIRSARGFELLSLQNKSPMTVPDPGHSAVEAIAPRLAGQKPLGMFRLYDGEFMLVYEDCGVYINKNGHISRSVILELIGKAKSASMFGDYLILFNEDFVEVRDSKSGRLRQIIAGKDIKCLDTGVEVRHEGGQSSVKFLMTHPEHPSAQLVMELVLNDDSRELPG